MSNVKKLRVGLLYGGASVEHDISVLSARNIAKYIDREQFEISPIRICGNSIWYFVSDMEKISTEESHYILKSILAGVSRWDYMKTS